MRIALRAVAAVFVVAMTGCSANEREATPPAGPELASGTPVPSRCVRRVVSPAATVAFAANGFAWALEPGTGRIACLFTVRDAGPFTWGPRGDRALLARLEVKALGKAPSRPPTAAAPSSASWGRPIGKAIVFVGRGGRALLKAHPGGGGFVDVTPVRGATHERVVYHPSGLAFAFILRQGGRESVWISSNLGKQPLQLVHGRFHTGFDALAFSQDGATLYFAAQHGDARVDVHSLLLGGPAKAPVEWRGGPDERVSEIVGGPGGELAFTVGRSCATRRAVVISPGHPKGADALPDVGTSRALGWIDDAHLLAAAGGCGRPLDLYSVAVRSLSARLLVRGVAAASVRRAERLPPPALPLKAQEAGSGVA